MKLSETSYIRILRIILLICAIVLLIRPIKTTAEGTLHGNNNMTVNYIELQNNDIMHQTFVCDVYQLRYILVTLNIDGDTMIDGSIELSLYVDDSLISRTTREILELEKSNQIGLDFPIVEDSYNKECYLEIIYFGDNSIKLQTSELINTSGVFKNNEKLEKSGIETKYIGNRNNYFFAWYPMVAFAVVSTVFSISRKGD